LTAVLDGSRNILLQNKLNKYLWGRVSEQKRLDEEGFDYGYQQQGDVLRTTLTLPSGEKKSFASRKEF
jgi:hypothetical protein